ncbi:hypothetical protein OESDEN_21103 [Oesophagostomum dentatum]|uniref:Uncharacterized protein n=1 Tax=Oesophagostomum dentatum TaxID=61180 RepID=A0A0B1S7S1_OESDE|nr:hypothetical protein OESDEN_21103 [Oesophagostomum dentatum]
MSIDVNVDDGTLPQMKLHYESEVIDYWKNMMDYDKQITVLSKLGAKPRAMAVSKTADESSTGGDLSLFELFLPLLAVVFTVLLVRFLVFRRQKQMLRSEESEKTPLFS